MSITIADVANTIARQLGEEYSDLDVQDAFDEWTLEIIEDIFSEESWPWSRSTQTLTTVASQANYTLNDNTGDIIEVYKTADNRRVLVRTLQEKLVDAGFDMTLQAGPSRQRCTPIRSCPP
jgi:hypothetical protein